MKKACFILYAWFLGNTISAQEVASSFLDKFGKDENLEVVTIGKKMIQMMEGLTSDDKDLAEVIKGLENITIITSNDSTLSKEYYDSAYEILTRKKQGFEPIVTLKGNGEDLIVMTKESKGTVKELILLSNNENREFNMISLNGKIDLKTIAKFSDKFNVSGLKVLESVNNK